MAAFPRLLQDTAPNAEFRGGRPAMIRVQRIGHATYETPDLERQVAYYTDVVGFAVVERSRDRVILATRLGHEVLVLERGSMARCARLSFEIAPGSLTDVVPQLAELGIAGEHRSGITPAIDDAIVFTDSKGTEIELFADARPPNALAATQGIAPMKLGHVAFIVPDAKAVTDFYVDHLGFRVSDWMEDFFSFLRCNTDHHTANFRTGGKIFMHHIAFELKDWAHLGHACETRSEERRV